MSYISFTQLVFHIGIFVSSNDRLFPFIPSPPFAQNDEEQWRRERRGGGREARPWRIIHTT